MKQDSGATSQRADLSGSGHTAVLVSGSNNHVNIGAVRVYLEPYVADRQVVGHHSGMPLLGELTLLHPQVVAVPLTGRNNEVDELWDWLDSKKRISIRVLVAPAGAGKTRLAIELCGAAIAKGWRAGFIRRRDLERIEAARNWSDWDWQADTFVVIDYAAARAGLLRNLITELSRNLGSTEPRLRILLLERHADERRGWWRALTEPDDSDWPMVSALFDPPSPIWLSALDQSARISLFKEMLARLGRHDLLNEDDAVIARVLSSNGWPGEPIFLMVAALTVARSGRFDRIQWLRATDAILALAGAESQRIRKFAVSRGLQEFLCHLAAYATLCQGLSAAEALSIISEEQRALGRQGSTDARDILHILQQALPVREGGPAVERPDTAISPVAPDLIGEAFVLRALGEGEESLATDAVMRAAARAWGRVVPGVIRAVQDFGSVSALPRVWLDRLAAKAVGGDQQQLAALLKQLPPDTLTPRDAQSGEMIARPGIPLD